MPTDPALTRPRPSGIVEYATSRPRVLGWVRSAAILDGDWGTSIAYVLGIGFALAGNSSFWHLSAMLALTALVAVNYITVCRLYPNGGGVYASARERSKNLAVVGALLLAADYVITMALSILEACHYLGIGDPVFWAMAIILMIAALNWYGPKHPGGVALVISLMTLVTLMTIIGFSMPASVENARIEPIEGSFISNWAIFVGIILSISGIESISNMTGLMKDPARDSRRAILVVLAKVVVATIFLGLAMHAVPGLEGRTEDMVRFLGEYYVGDWFGWVVALSLGLLLISAGNTAMNGFISVLFLMAVDRELPASMRKLNRHGVPIIPLVFAAATPITVLVFVHDIISLAHLYAIGVVGAVLINIGSTATNRTLNIRKMTRVGMYITAIVLFFVEVSIAVEKKEAALFASIVLVAGLSARYATQRKPAPAMAPSAPSVPGQRRRTRRTIPAAKYLLAMKSFNEKLLRFGVEEAKTRNAFLFVLRVKEIAVGTLPERVQMLTNGEEHRIEELCAKAGIDYQVISVPSNEVGYTIAEQAATFGVDRVMVGASSRNLIENVLKGSTIRSVGTLLPEEIQLIIFGG